MNRFKFWAFCLSALVLSVSAISWVPAGFGQKNISTVFSGKSDSTEATAAAASPLALFDQYVKDVYTAAGLDKSSMDLNVFRKAVTGFYNFKDAKLLSPAKSVITIVDFNKPSSQKRLWIIDLANKKLIYNTLVAHGQGSGDNLPNNFSNTPNSNQSSLGFYITDETYQGKHGLSLRIDGMDKGFNSNARERAVVVHGADYVSESFVASHGRLGRSWGCPALPPELTAPIINMIKGKTVIYIDGPSSTYKSAYLDQQAILHDFAPENSALQASL